MKTHRNDDRRDRERWRVDLAHHTATHDTGLVVQFQKTEDGWNGTAMNVDSWEHSLPIDELVKAAPRLLRLAGEAFSLAVAKAEGYPEA